MVNTYINNIKNNYLKKFEFLLDVLKNKEDSCLAVFDEGNECFLKYDGDSFLLIFEDSETESINSEKRIETSKAKEYIDNAEFEDLYYYDSNKKKHLFFGKEYKTKEGEVGEVFDNTKFLQDYLKFIDLEPYDLSHNNISDNYYKFSFEEIDDEGNIITKSFLVFPELVFYNKENVFNEDKIFGDEESKKKVMRYSSEIESSLGCIITKLIDGNADFINSESISLDELNLVMAAQISCDKEITPLRDTLAIKLLKKYLVSNEGNDGVKEKEESIFKGVSFYIDDETGHYIVELKKGEFNIKKEFNNFEDFEKDKELLKLLSQYEYKEASVNLELLNYEATKDVLRRKINDNENEFIETVSNYNKFENNDNLNLCIQYYCILTEESIENISKEMATNTHLKKYLEKALKEDGDKINLKKLRGNHCKNFLSEILIDNHLIIKDNKDKFNNIKAIYTMYNLDSTDVIELLQEKIRKGIQIDSNEIREIFIKDFDAKYWEATLTHLAMLKNEQTQEYIFPNIKEKSKEELFLYLAEIAFIENHKNYIIKDNDKINLDDMFKDNTIIYSDLDLLIGEKPVLAEYSKTLNELNGSNSFKRKSQLLKIESKDLNIEELRNVFNEQTKEENTRYNILLKYIQSSIRYPDDSIELKKVIKRYERDINENGKEFADLNLQRIFLTTNIDKNNEEDTYFKSLYKENEKNLNAFIEYYSLDFSEVMTRVLSGLNENENSINFSIWNDKANCSIIKKSENEYLFKIDFANGQTKEQTYFSLNKVIECLNYKNEKGVCLISDEDKQKMLETYRDKSFEFFSGEILEANYKDSENNSNDSINVQIQKILAKGDSVVFRKNMDKIGTFQFVLLQKTDDDKIIKKTVEVLQTNKNISKLNAKAFGTKYLEEINENETQRSYYLLAESKDNPYSKNPDVLVSTEYLSSKELTNFVDKLNLRAWDIEENERIENINSKNGITIEEDKAVFDLARTSSMTIQEKRLFILNEKIKNHLLMNKGDFNICSYANISVEKNDEKEVITKDLISIENSEGKDSEGKAEKFFDMNIIKYISIKDKDGNITEMPMVQKLEKALYLDGDELKISNYCTTSVEKVLDLLSENKVDAKCSTFFRNNADKKEIISKGISKVAEDLGNYHKYYKGILKIQEKYEIGNNGELKKSISDENFNIKELRNDNDIRNLLEKIEKDYDELSQNDKKDKIFSEFFLKEVGDIINRYSNIRNYLSKNSDSIDDLFFQPINLKNNEINKDVNEIVDLCK